jgi:hypothetical protein
MPNMSRGFKRLTAVVSAVLSLPLLALALMDSATPTLWLVLGALGFAVPWGVFFVTRWVVQGFRTPAGQEGEREVPTAGKLCPRCGYRNPEGARRCTCGLSLDEGVDLPSVTAPTKTTPVGRLLAAGFAASEIGALMMIFSAIAVVGGVKSSVVVLDILLFAGFGAWLWWRESPVAAGLMLALVAFEYSYLAYSAVEAGKTNSWLGTYLVLFFVAFFAHARKPKVAPAPAAQA